LRAAEDAERRHLKGGLPRYRQFKEGFQDKNRSDRHRQGF
jgi:hypothetical protein